ncbi:hypothetical protein Ga0061065_11478 [Marinomonas fungiae]|uniref:DUF2474 domain-containing protein n=1 Tax=Marinomonas fungiae TaxID=1137284 RepID=A0A0K6ISH9_9GAMM|nr:hypothetical protein Ga0061065_11478 [Marinomonas fungiae]
MERERKLKSWQWFALLYLAGLITLSMAAYGLRFLINHSF